MKNNVFGDVPYQACFYGSLGDDFVAHKSSMDEMEQLKFYLSRFKHGDFKDINKLVLMLESSNKDVRQYSHQLFAHVCSHDQIDEFKRVLNVDLSIDEAKRVVVRLGESLSLKAIPIIFDFVHEFNDSELYGFASMALHNLFPANELDDEDFFESRKRDLYVANTRGLNQEYYYYRGKPIFVGDVTKELISASAVSYAKHAPIVLVRQAQMLSNFSGHSCPIKNRDVVGDFEMEAVMKYVKFIAENQEWQKGAKYFYNKKIR